MASGTIMGSFTGTATSNVRPAIEWSSTPNTTGNYSDVTATLVFYRYNTSWGSWNANGHTVTFTIDGNSSSSSRTFDIRGKSREVIWTRTRRVNHNSNGSKSIGMGASGNTGTSLGSYNFSSSVALDTIARASTLTSFNIQSALQPSTANTINLSITRESSSFTHDITLLDGNTAIQSWNGQGLPTTLTISSASANTLLNRMSTDTTRVLTLRVQTKSGSSNIGSPSTRNATITVHSSVTPNATGLSVSISGSGVDNTIGKFVQNISRVYGSFNSSATGGAYLTAERITIRRVAGSDSQTIHGRTGTTGRSVSLNGTYEAIASATDSRGRTTTQTITFTVHAYGPPQITGFRTSRQDATPTVVDITRSAVFSHLGGDNPITVLIEKQPINGSWATVQTMTNASGTIGATITSSGNSVTLSYNFRMTVTDRFGNETFATDTVSTQSKVFDVYRDIGVAFGNLYDPNMGGAIQAGEGIFLNGVQHDYKTTDLPNGDGSKAYWSALPSGVYMCGPGTIPFQPRDWGYVDVKNNGGTVWLTFQGVGSGQHSMWKTNFNTSSLESQTSEWQEVAEYRYGVNSNGGWIRYSNGVQICWSRGTTTVQTTNDNNGVWWNNIVYDYPVSFSTIPTVSTADRRTAGGVIWSGTRTVGTTAVDIYGMSSSNGGYTQLSYIAIGMWN